MELTIRVDVEGSLQIFQYNESEISNASWRSSSLVKINYNTFICRIILVS